MSRRCRERAAQGGWLVRVAVSFDQRLLMRIQQRHRQRRSAAARLARVASLWVSVSVALSLLRLGLCGLLCECCRSCCC